MTIRTIAIRALGGVQLIMALASSAFAQGVPAPQSEAEPPWRFSVTPVGVWGMSIKGPVTARGFTRNVDASFSDIFDKKQGAIGLNATATKGRVGAFFSFSYLKIGQDNVGTIDPSDVSLKGLVAELGATYAAYVRPKLTISVLGGARYSGIKGEIQAVDGSFDFESKTAHWVDPFVGAQAVKPIGKKFAVAVRADVGGFDISSHTSKLTWNIIPSASYRFPMSGGKWNLLLSAGYRFESVDFTGEGPQQFQMDIDEKGPTVGLTIAF
jgi:hypothetical protein